MTTLELSRKDAQRIRSSIIFGRVRSFPTKVKHDHDTLILDSTFTIADKEVADFLMEKLSQTDIEYQFERTSDGTLFQFEPDTISAPSNIQHAVSLDKPVHPRNDLVRALSAKK